MWDLFAGVRDIVGGRSAGYVRFLRQARETAIEEMVAEAEKLGADAVIGGRRRLRIHPGRAGREHDDGQRLRDRCQALTSHPVGGRTSALRSRNLWEPLFALHKHLTPL